MTQLSFALRNTIQKKKFYRLFAFRVGFPLQWEALHNFMIIQLKEIDLFSYGFRLVF